MATVKTAVSLSRPVFEMAGKLARKLKIPRSRVFSNAIVEYYRRQETQQLIDGLNEANADGLDEDDRKFLDAALRQWARRTKDDKW